MSTLRISAVAAMLACLSTGQAVASECEFRRDLEFEVDLAGTELLQIDAKAGYLVINGESGLDRAQVTAVVCASKAAWLDEIEVESTEGVTARIEVGVPEFETSWFWWNNHYARVDLEIRVPDTLALDIRDSSGSMQLADTGPLEIRDSSGSIRIERAHGSIELRDSSGSVTFDGVDGDVTIVSDSSGSISGTGVDGNVLVKKDSSGSIRFTRVTGDFIVERDSSGDINAVDVGGDFRVLKDGSGGITHSGVAGAVSLPDE